MSVSQVSTGGQAISENDKEKPRNDKRGAHLQGKRVRFGIEKPAKAGPGRPPIPQATKDAIAEAKKILKDASPFAAARLVEIAAGRFTEFSIRACSAILNKTIPDLEEGVMQIEHAPLGGIAKDILRELAAAPEGAPSSNGHSGNGSTNGGAPL